MINQNVAEIAFERTTGMAFERYFQSVFVLLYPEDFVPLGGTADGGADAFTEPLYGKAHRFFQASREADSRSKIRATIARLREFGREPRELIYATSRIVEHIDRVESELSDSLGVAVRIRDQRWFVANVNRDAATAGAFESYLRAEVAFLAEAGGSQLAEQLPTGTERALFVFLQQELSRRSNNADLLNSTTDSLILWALQGTDPDLGRFCTRNEILEKIETILPGSKAFIRGEIDKRLGRLSSKDNDSGREIRFHRTKGYCLPYETRVLVESENAADAVLKKRVLKRFADVSKDAAIAKHITGVNDEVVAGVANASIEKAFESQGLELSAFLAGQGSIDDHLSLAEHMESALDEAKIAGAQRSDIKQLAVEVLRHAFYASTEDERIYFNKLSRTFALFFALRADTRVIEYFRTMSTRLVLYVGADLIIRSLSEQFLRREDRMTTNLLEILHSLGTSLILSEKALEEVHSHLKGTDHEFTNWFQPIEATVPLDVVRHCSKILIRAYFYAKRSAPEGVEAPASWTRYIDQWVSLSKLHSIHGKEELREYLQARHHFEFESTNQMLVGVEEGQLDGLKEMLMTVKTKQDKGDLLAYNDALQILRVYAKRSELKEGFRPNPYGYRVWWLTHEVHVMKATGPLVKHHNARYIMRPEFLLNFVALAPTAAEVRKAYRTVFPTLLAINLSNRLKDDIFHDVLQKMKNASKLEPARIEVKLRELADRLKGDNFKEYERDLRFEP